MATAPLGAKSAPVTLSNNFAQAAAVMAQFDRAAIVSAVEVLVNLLDVFDGDPDNEATDAEDDFGDYASLLSTGPGCKISDPDAAVDDSDCDDVDMDLEPEEGVLIGCYGMDQTRGPKPQSGRVD